MSLPGSGFESDTNYVTIFSVDGTAQCLPQTEKSVIADAVIHWLITLLGLKQEND